MSGWPFVTQWGNAVLMLPAALGIALGLSAAGDWKLARRWSVCFGVAVILVTATKVAFLGWGIGSRRLDFTGISGHSMLAAAVLPMLAWWIAQGYSRSTQRWAIGFGLGLALLVGISRVVLEFHSISEVVTGLALGLLVSWAVIPRAEPGAGRHHYRWVLVSALVVAGAMMQGQPYDEAHGLVVRVAQLLSGRSETFTRDML